MTTPTSRRSFITTLAGLTVAPFIAARVLASTRSAPTSCLSEPFDTHTFPGVPQRSFVVAGRAIKVPSNRLWVEDVEAICRDGYHPYQNAYHRYVGHWDGTLKLERGCANPAWIWLDLCERAYSNRPKRLAAEIAVGITDDTKQGRLDLRDLYDFGCWCDELTYGITNEAFERRKRNGQGFPASEMADFVGWMPRFSLNVVLPTQQDEDAMRDNLRFQFVHWRAAKRWGAS